VQNSTTKAVIVGGKQDLARQSDFCTKYTSIEDGTQHLVESALHCVGWLPLAVAIGQEQHS
jgi:hypothetical protein